MSRVDEQPDDEERVAALLAVLALGGTGRTGGEALGRWRAERSARASRASIPAEGGALSVRSPRRA
jgi:hypothetical protein